MDYELTWTRPALDDIGEIARYLAREAPFYAGAVVTRILAVAEDSVVFPLSGRVVPEWNNAEYRERFVYDYRIIYRVFRNTVVISAIIHGRRRIESIENRLE